MDETTFRILDTLTREIGRPLSILELTSKIKELHETAYYANTYRQLRNMAAHGLISLTKAGKSAIASLNPTSYLLIDLLTEIELTRKRKLLQERPELNLIFADLDKQCKDLDFIKSISMIRPEKNFKLNRIELLIILRNHDFSNIAKIHEILRGIQRRYNIRIDYLPLQTAELLGMLGSDEDNPLKEMLADKICLLSAQSFWGDILDSMREGLRIRSEEKEIYPSKIGEQSLTYNLARFGYREFGPEIRQSRDICKELLAASLLISDDARRIEAIPIILAKGKTNWHLLIFLTEKYGLSGRLFGLLKALYHYKPTKDLEEAIKLLELTDVKETKADMRSIGEKLRLYDAIR